MRGCYADMANVGAILYLMKRNSRISSAWTRQLLTSPWSWGTQDTKLREVIPSQEKLTATLRRLNYYITTGEFLKHSFISSAFRLPKMHRATRD